MFDHETERSSEQSDLVFKQQPKFSPQDIQEVTEKISTRVLGYLDRHGLIEGDIESRYISGDLFAHRKHKAYLFEKVTSRLNNFTHNTSL